MKLFEIIFTIIASIAIVLSVLNNLLTVLVIVKNKFMRTVTNLFLATVAVSDVLLASVVIPILLHDIGHTQDFYEGQSVVGSN